MNYLVCYDITDNKLRKKIADKLFYYGLSRVQLSVFIGYVNDIHFERMQNEITEKMNENKKETDSIIFLLLLGYVLAHLHFAKIAKKKLYILIKKDRPLQYQQVF